jgi:hypothetical protein
MDLFSLRDRSVQGSIFQFSKSQAEPQIEIIFALGVDAEYTGGHAVITSGR